MRKCISILLLIFSLMLMVFSPAKAQDENLLSEARIPIHSDNVQGLRRLASISLPNTMTAIRTATELVFSPASLDEPLLLMQRIHRLGGTSIARLWNMATGEEHLAMGVNLLKTYLIFSPEGIALFGFVFEDQEEKLGVWDIANGQKLDWHLVKPRINCRLPLVVNNIFFNSQDALLAAGYNSCDKIVLIWNARTGQIVSQWESLQPYPVPANIAPDTVVDLDEDGLALIHVMDGRKIIELPLQTLSAAVSPDGKTLAIVDKHYQVMLWDIISGEQIGQVKSDETSIHDFIYSPDGSLLVAATDEAILFWDAETLELLHRIEGNMMSEVAFSPDGSLLAVGGLMDEVTLWGVLE